MYRIIPLLDRALLFCNNRLVAECRGSHGAVSAMLAYCDANCIRLEHDPRREGIAFLHSIKGNGSSIVDRALVDQPTRIDRAQFNKEKLELARKSS